MTLVLDLRITHDRARRSSNPSLNGNLHYPADIDWTLNEDAGGYVRGHGNQVIREKLH